MLFAEGFTFRNFLIDVFGIGVLVLEQGHLEIALARHCCIFIPEASTARGAGVTLATVNAWGF
jgi:hypothetical protein